MTIQPALKGLLKKLLSATGYEIHRALPQRGIRTSVADSYALIRELGFNPKTVLDVGVAGGTPDLYRSFPDSFLVLVEPLEQFQGAIKSILAERRGLHVAAAAGSSSGVVAFNVHDHHLDGSSLLEETTGAVLDGHKITVPLVRIDDVVREHHLEPPFFVKVDVQGGELAVLEGSIQTLVAAEAVALEVSMFGFLKGGPQFYDVVHYMKEQGFVAFDIVPGWNRPLDGALGQVDIVFVKEQGRFRRDHSFGTVEQIRSIFGGVNA
jgi:FkbM family methyltransferase